jgi:hypothetical protein
MPRAFEDRPSGELVHNAFMRRALAMAVVMLGCSNEAASVAPEGDAALDETAAVDTGADETSDGESPDATTDGKPAEGDPPTTVRTFEEDTALVLDPERGFMDGGGIALTDTASYDGERAAGYSLAYAKVRLDSYRDKALDSAFLDKLDAGFARVRKAGIKVVLRFVYNDGTGDDATLTRIQGHIAQLGPTLTKNVDVIAVMQGGFIGLWGEWHSSTNGLETKAARTAVVDAILAALPSSRKVQVRTPHFKSERFPAPVTEPFGTTPIARIAHHNDCFLASDDDAGTYLSPIETEKTYLAADSAFLPVGGESCRVNEPRTLCPTALEELARFHWSFYNPQWHPDVLTGWKTGGCHDEILRRLGYRFVLTKATYAPALKPGAVMPLALEIRNDGFGALYNPRPVKVVLDDGAKKWTATLDVDPRTFAAGKTSTISVRLRLPATAKVGKATLSLAMPDASPAIEARPEYAVRLASKGVWNPTTGLNLLATDITIDPSAPGAADPSATTFTQLP